MFKSKSLHFIFKKKVTFEIDLVITPTRNKTFSEEIHLYILHKHKCDIVNKNRQTSICVNDVPKMLPLSKP